MQIWLELAQLHVTGGFGRPILLQGAGLEVNLPRLLTEEKHVRRAFHQRFVQGFRILLNTRMWVCFFVLQRSRTAVGGILRRVGTEVRSGVNSRSAPIQLEERFVRRIVGLLYYFDSPLAVLGCFDCPRGVSYS